MLRCTNWNASPNFCSCLLFNHNRKYFGTKNINHFSEFSYKCFLQLFSINHLIKDFIEKLKIFYQNKKDKKKKAYFLIGKGVCCWWHNPESQASGSWNSTAGHDLRTRGIWGHSHFDFSRSNKCIEKFEPAWPTQKRKL